MAPKRGNGGMKKEKSSVDSEPLTLVDWFEKFVSRIDERFPLLDGSCRLQLYCGMPIPTFSYICSLVNEPMAKSQEFRFDDDRKENDGKENDRKIICLYDKVAMALRRLKYGEPLDTIRKELKVGHTFTTHSITQSFVEALAENGLRHLQWPVPEEEMAPRAFDRLKEEWKILSTVMMPKKRPLMTLACCILHNIVSDMNDGRQRELLLQDHVPSYLQETAESVNGTSADLRERLPMYLSGNLKADVLLNIKMNKYFIRLSSYK